MTKNDDYGIVSNSRDFINVFEGDGAHDRAILKNSESGKKSFCSELLLIAIGYTYQGPPLHLHGN